jgi:phage tail protein X
MIWLRHRLGTPFRLTFRTIPPLDGVTARAAARGSTGELWPLGVNIDAPSGTIKIDGEAVGRIWPQGRLWMDVRLERADRLVWTQTLGITVLDADELHLAQLRAQPLPLALGQRRVWTTDGEALDALCKRELGAEAWIARVLDLNPGLAALGPLYPAGVGVVLPEVPPGPPATRRPVRLWGRA